MGLWFFLLLLSALWWRRLRGLCQLPDRRDWWWEKWGLALVDRALLNKANSIICWWVGLCSLPDSRLARDDPVLGSTGCMVGLTSKRAYTMGDLLNLLLPVPHPCGEPLPTQASTEEPPTLTRKFWFSLLWGHCSFPLGLGACKISFVPSKTGVSFPQSCGSPIIKFHWPSRSDSLGISSPFCQIPRLGCLMLGSEPSQQWENFFGIIVLRFVGHSPGGYGIWFYHDCAPPTIFLQLLCHWALDIFFGIFYPAFSCQWLFRR